MASQYDLFRTDSGTLVVVIQSDLLDEIRTRVVMPLLPEGRAGKPMQRLNPVLTFEGEILVVMPQLMATLSIVELGHRVGSMAEHRDTLTSAIDTLLSGV